jgi:murein DD-endopeptidase MepM/ murein hydrolase activator NlpD
VTLRAQVTTRALVATAAALSLAFAGACSSRRPPEQHAERAARERERVQAGRATVHVVERGQTLWRICHTYGVPLDVVVDANGIDDPALIEVGQRILIPGATRRVEVEASSTGTRKRREPPPAETPPGRFVWPLEGPITSRFGVRRSGGRRHQGIDIDAERGAPIRAAADGRVVFAGKRRGYGRLVILSHEDGYATWYAHGRSLRVRAGEKVRRGEVIATVGRSGWATGSHLHFEVRHRGRPIDPFLVLVDGAT